MRVSLRVAILLGLAAAPVAAEPEDKPAVTIGGYVETYYQLNLRLPSNRLTSLRGFDDRDRTFTIENAAIDARGERGPLSARVILQVGETGAISYAAEPGDRTLWRHLQQATLAYTTRSKIVVDAGLFPSPIGPEVLPVKDSWNWSRSDLFYALPYYHTGARIAVPLGCGWTGMLHVYSGWNSVVDNNAYPSVGLSAAYASKRVQGQVLYFGGIERPPGAPEGTPWRHLLDAYATVAVTDELSVLVHADTGFERADNGTEAWAALALYGKLQLGKQLYAAVRGDVFDERTSGRVGTLFFPVAWVGSGTATLAYQPAPTLSVRFEYRHDHAKSDAYFGGDVLGDGTSSSPYVANRRMQDTLTLGATAWF